ncbi:jg9608 [Pararge aegeria aegeria]|uniref:Jg9608 protein n=1 Tax=Pararge aegeria aegeria TaxID=348720 RepID=A0A8S4RSK0_9NEOP|nr:jg9608 [Pararge aegeria aegeria]
MPSLTYGCQPWLLRKEDEEKLAICQRKMERSMLGLRVKDRVSKLQEDSNENQTCRCNEKDKNFEMELGRTCLPVATREMDQESD